MKKTNIFAILSIIFAFLIPLLGLVFGIIAVVKIRKSKEKGELLAVIGILFSAFFLIFFFIILGLGILFIRAVAENRNAIVFLEPEERLSDEELNHVMNLLVGRLNTYRFNAIAGEAASNIIAIETNDMVVQSPIFEGLLEPNLFQGKIGDKIAFQNGEDIAFVCRTEQCAGVDPGKGCYQNNSEWVCGFRFSISLSREAAEELAEITNDLDIIKEGYEEYLSEKLILYLDGRIIDELRIGADLKGKAAADIMISGIGAGETRKDAISDSMGNMRKLQAILQSEPLPTSLSIMKIASKK
jgi:hypothetical protein